MHFDIISVMIKWITFAIQLGICVRKFSAIFFLLGSLGGPNFTQFLPSTQSNGQLWILILNIQSILCSCDRAWTFY